MFRSFTFFCLTRGTDKRSVKWDQNLKRRDHVKHIDVSYYYLHFMFTYVCVCVCPALGKSNPKRNRQFPGYSVSVLILAQRRS